MSGHEHRVERQRRLQPALDLAQEVLEEALLDRPAGLRQRDAQRHRRPGPTAVHLGEETGQVGHGDGGAGARFAHDLVAADVDVLLEIRCGGDRREPVALDGETQNGNPRIVLGHGLLPQAANADAWSTGRSWPPVYKNTMLSFLLNLPGRRPVQSWHLIHSFGPPG